MGYLNSFDIVNSSDLGVAVTDTRYYPDFHVDQYFGADIDDNPEGDIARIVVELGSRNAHKLSVARQLTNYMDVIGPVRSRGCLLGIGLIGAEVLLLQKKSGESKRLYEGWISMFDPRFVEVLDGMLSYCKNDDHPNL